MIERSVVASSEREQTTTKPKGSAKLNEGANRATPEPWDQHQRHHSQNSLALYICNRQFTAKIGLISHQHGEQ